VYCLADRYIIPELKTLALSKLHEILKKCMDVGFVTTHQRVKDVVALVQFAYDSKNIRDRNNHGQHDPLRTEVLKYVVAHIDHLESQPAFQILLSGQGQLSVDLVSCLKAEHRVAMRRIGAAIEYRKSSISHSPQAMRKLRPFRILSSTG
jgi:hypothetical protein